MSGENNFQSIGKAFEREELRAEQHLPIQIHTSSTLGTMRRWWQRQLTATRASEVLDDPAARNQLYRAHRRAAWTFLRERGVFVW